MRLVCFVFSTLLTASAVAVEATPATTGTRPAAASIVTRTTSARWALPR